MSLELKIEALTAAVQALTTVMQSGQQAVAQFGAAADTSGAGKTTTRKSKKDEAPATDGKTINPNDVVTGDPEGTRYWVIEAHNTVFVQKPGDPDITMGGQVQVGAIEYLQKKDEFAKKAQSLLSTGTQSGAAAGHTPSTNSSQKPSDAPASGATYKQVVDACMALNAGTEPGQGREALKDFLMKHVGKDAQGKPKTVPALETLGKFDELLAELNALLNPAAAAATDENLFG